MPWFHFPGCGSSKRKGRNNSVVLENGETTSNGHLTSSNLWLPQLSKSNSANNSSRRSFMSKSSSLKKTSSISITHNTKNEIFQPVDIVKNTSSLQHLNLSLNNSISSLSENFETGRCYKSLWGKDLAEWQSNQKISQEGGEGDDVNQKLEIIDIDLVSLDGDCESSCAPVQKDFRFIDIKALLSDKKFDEDGNSVSAADRSISSSEESQPQNHVKKPPELKRSATFIINSSCDKQHEHEGSGVDSISGILGKVVTSTEKRPSPHNPHSSPPSEYSRASPISPTASQPEGSSSLRSSSSSVASSSHANSVSLDLDDSGTFCYSDDSERIILLPSNTESEDTDNDCKPNAKNEELLRNTLADIDRERQCHAEEISSLASRHEVEINELNSKLEVQINSLKEVHLQQVNELNQNHRFEIDKVKILLNREIASKVEKVSQLENRIEGLVLELERERECHREEIQSLIENHERELQTLNQRIDTLKESHELQLEEITKNRLSQIEHLESVHKAKIVTLKRKHEEKLGQQLKQVPDNILKKEIESLEVVLQLKNQELKEMRKDLLEFKTKNDDLGFIYEQNKVLHAKVEDLEAQIEKTRTDKNTILEKFNVMETSMHQMINENDRLHLNNEQLSYKIEMMTTSDHSFVMSEASEGDVGNPSLPE